MRLASFEATGGGTAIGVVSADGRELVDLQGTHRALQGRAASELDSMQALIEAGSEGLALAAALAEASPHGSTLGLDGVRLLAPLPRPPQIRDFLCFEDHLRNSFAQAEKLTGERREIPPVWFEQPIYYKANRFSVIGPDANVTWPAYSMVMDYELELACVIGRAGRDIAPEDAASHVFGYTIFNDASARDAQMREMAGQLGPAKQLPERWSPTQIHSVTTRWCMPMLRDAS